MQQWMAIDRLKKRRRNQANITHRVMSFMQAYVIFPTLSNSIWHDLPHRLKTEGLRRVVARLAGRSMDLLDLSRNDIGDSGFEFLAAQILKGAVIKRYLLKILFM